VAAAPRRGDRDDSSSDWQQRREKPAYRSREREPTRPPSTAAAVAPRPSSSSSSHRAAAVAPRPSSSNPRAQPLEGPQFVPRQPGIGDGVWTKRDEELVRDAIADSVAHLAPPAAASAAPSTEDAAAARAARAAAANKEATAKVLLALSDEELKAVAESTGQLGYRGKQLKDALLQGARAVADISTLPKSWREELVAAGYRTGRSRIFETREAPDGTRKFLLQVRTAATGLFIRILRVFT
jgi:hypothetical protein